jgi:hypothetical protein
MASAFGCLQSRCSFPRGAAPSTAAPDPSDRAHHPDPRWRSSRSETKRQLRVPGPRHDRSPRDRGLVMNTNRSWHLELALVVILCAGSAHAIGALAIGIGRRDAGSALGGSGTEETRGDPSRLFRMVANWPNVNRPRSGFAPVSTDRHRTLGFTKPEVLGCPGSLEELRHWLSGACSARRAPRRRRQAARLRLLANRPNKPGSS